jgi:hypothetical protein
MLGAIPADFLAGAKDHGVVLFLDLTLQLALRCPSTGDWRTCAGC